MSDSQKAPRVLVVDDSLTVRGHLAELLEDAGYEVLEAGTLTLARARLERGGIELVFLDVNLPDGTGFELLAELRAAPGTADLPVVFLSSEQDAAHRVSGLAGGAVAYVGKPFAAEQVRWLARRHAPLVAETTPTVLLIEDSLTERAAMQELLVARGLRVTLAADGEAGLVAAFTAPPSVVVVDGELPNMSGARVIRRIRLDPLLRQIPVLMRTGSGSSEAEALDAGADAYVTKSVDPGLFLARLEALLERAPGDAPHAPEARPNSLLLVQPDSKEEASLREALRSLHASSVVVRSGEDALEVLRVEPADCVIVNWNLPKMSAVELCHQMRRAPLLAHIPVVMTMDESGDRVAAIRAGADEVLDRATEPRVLRARVEAQLRRKRREDEKRHALELMLRAELDAEQARASQTLAEQRAGFIVDLEQANLSLDEARGLAERESQFKSRFLASMSHELRTPLTAIIGFGQLLADGAVPPASEEGQRLLELSLDSAKHLLQLVNDVLDLSKVEAGKLDLHLEVFMLGPFVSRVISSLEGLASERGVCLAELQISPIKVCVDAVRFRQILFNLLSNAIKFTPGGGAVSVEVSTSDSWLTLTVIDSGVGIAPDDLDRIFREFEQAGEIDARSSGTGLGLPLTRRLVELHGGTLSASSEVGEGSRFVAHMPVLANAESVATFSEGPAEMGPASRWPGPPLRILLVEDNARNRQLIQVVLKHHTLTEAASVTEAKQILAETPAFDLALLDLRLPDGTGDEVLGVIRSNPELREIPAVAFTATAMPGTRERLAEMGFDSYVPKPFDVRTFAQTIEEVARSEFATNPHGIPAPTDALEAALAPIRAVMRERLHEALPELRDAIGAATSAGASSAREVAHELAGSAGSVGFHQCTARARELEEALATWSEGEPTQGLLERLEALEAAVAAECPEPC